MANISGLYPTHVVERLAEQECDTMEMEPVAKDDGQLDFIPGDGSAELFEELSEEGKTGPGKRLETRDLEFVPDQQLLDLPDVPVAAPVEDELPHDTPVEDELPHDNPGDQIVATPVAEAVAPRPVNLSASGALSQLPKVPLFNTIPEAALAQLMESMAVRYCSGGEEILSRGHVVDRLFLVLEGRAEERGLGSCRSIAEGELFGEEVLFSGSLSTRSYVCPETCILLEFPAEKLWPVLEAHPDLRHLLTSSFRAQMVAELLRQHELFTRLEDVVRRELAGRFTLTTAPAGQQLVEQGSHADGLYVLVHGTADVTLGDHHVAQIPRWQAFGKHSLVRRVPSRVSVTAASDCWLLKLDRLAFLELIMSCPGLIKRMAKMRMTGGLPTIHTTVG